MPDTPAGTNVSPPLTYRPSVGPGLLLVIALLSALGAGCLIWQILVVPYQQDEITGPMAFGPIVEGCQPQVRIEHPTRLSLDDRGVQPNKRIVLTLECEKPLARTVPVTLVITSDPPGWVRFLNAQGEDVVPSLVAEIPPHGQDRVALYPECLNHPVSLPRQITITVVSVPPAGRRASFTIKLESRAQSFLRRVVSSILGPLSAGQLALLSSLGALLWRWWKTWNEKRQRFDSLYNDMCKSKNDLQTARDLYSRYRGLRSVFPLSIVYRDIHIEDLYHTIEAEECLLHVIEGLEKDDFETAREWHSNLFTYDHFHWSVSALGCSINLLAGDSATSSWRCLAQIQKGWDKANAWPKLRRQMVRAISRIPLAKAREFLEKVRDDKDLGVRIEIAWTFSKVQRPPYLDQRLQRLIAAPLDEWLRFQEVHDPFGTAVAESADPAAEPFIWEHPLYEQLYPPAATIVLAPGGGGKTTARLALKRRFWGTSSAVFVLEYTDFHRLVAHPERISAYRHMAEILRCAARAVATLLIDDPERLDAVQDPYARRLIHSLLTSHLFAPHLVEQLKATLEEKVPSPDGKPPNLLSGRSPGDIMRDVVTIVQALGFDELYLLVDGLNNLPETRNLDVAEALLRHLVNDSAFLDVPHLRVKLFLPDRWEPLVADCEGVRSGRIHLLRLQWDGESLLEMLRMRLQVAGVESLNRLAVEEIYPPELDKALAREAEGSPRRLIELGKALLCLRALGWEESGRDPSEARLRTEDWATMLEYGLRRAAGG